MADHEIKRHDTKPSVVAALKIGGSTPATPLTGTVEFIMAPILSSDTFGAVKVKKPAVVVDASAWIVRYDFEPEDTDTSGSFAFEWEHSPASGGTQTFPGNAYHSLTIFADLDNEGGTP